jgi:hypothetical protein
MLARPTKSTLSCQGRTPAYAYPVAWRSCRAQRALRVAAAAAPLAAPADKPAGESRYKLTNALQKRLCDTASHQKTVVRQTV